MGLNTGVYIREPDYIYNLIIEGTIEAYIGTISGWVLKNECKQEEYILL